MTPEQARAQLQQEVASGSAAGRALLALLAHAEVENYRQSAKTADPYHLARICGRGEGIHAIATQIAPVKYAAPQGLPNTSAAEGLI